jgi:hypothetical protein
MESSEQASGETPSLQEKLAPKIEEARKNLNDLNTKAVKFIREHPGTCLLGALAFGYVVGRIASRR